MTNTKRHLDSFSVISTVACTVIGVGIFYKNSTVFTTVDNNWIAVLFSWILVTFVCICTSISYSRISLLNPTDLGLCGWAETIVNKGFSNLVSQIFIFYKMGICIPAYCFYGADTFLRIFHQQPKLQDNSLGTYSSFAMVMIIGLLILGCFLSLNYLRPDLGISIQKAFFRLKFVPIFMAIVFGVVIACIKRSGGLFANNSSSSANNGFSFTKAISATPGIMMAFDAFLNPGFYSTRLKEPKKQLPKIYLISIAIFATVYLTITVNQLLSGKGDVIEIFSQDILGEVWSKIIKFIFLLFVFISALGLVNGYSNTMIPALIQAFDDDVFCLGRCFFKRYSNKRKAAFALWLCITGFWSCLMIIYCFWTNSGAVLDRLTDIPALFMFSVYGLLSGIYFLKSIKDITWKNMNTREKKDIYLFGTASIIAFMGWCSIAAFQFIYNCIYLPASAPLQDTTLNSIWGSNKINNLQASYITIFCMVSMIALYFLDRFLKRKSIK